jgi:hypothetical protein
MAHAELVLSTNNDKVTITFDGHHSYMIIKANGINLSNCIYRVFYFFKFQNMSVTFTDKCRFII